MNRSSGAFEASALDQSHDSGDAGLQQSGFKGNASLDWLSALADGEVDATESHVLVNRLLSDPALRNRWAEIHAVGDLVRSEDLLIGSDVAFARFAARLHEEPTVLAPRARHWQRNRLMRYGLPSAAAVAAVALSGMAMFQLMPRGGGDVVIANSAPAVSSVAAINVNSPLQAGEGHPAGTQAIASNLPPVDQRRLREYLDAHRQFSTVPATSVQTAEFVSITGSRPAGR